MEHPKAIGDRSTLAIMLGLQSDGYVVSVPFGENTRYDLIADDGVRLLRVQCKTGRLREGAIRFNTASSYAHLPAPREVRRTYHGQIDAFAVYCGETGGIYLIPIGDVDATNEARLRIDSPRNSQRRRVRFASQYEVTTVRLGSEPVRSQLSLTR